MNRRRFLIHAWALVMGSAVGWRWPGTAGAASLKPTPGDRGGQIALIIDDIGYSRTRTAAFLALKLPLTFSILPQLPKSTSLARIIQREGREIMLHQPMEPNNRHLDPGPGALYVQDPAERISRTIESNLEANSRAAGVNNHMGSRFTCRAGKIEAALEVVKHWGLYFVDSLTSPRSVAHHTARRMGLNTGCNRYFIDPVIRESMIYSQLVRLESAARRHGQAIGIGHPHLATARALARFSRSPGTGGRHWVSVSTIFNGPDGLAPETNVSDPGTPETGTTPQPPPVKPPADDSVRFYKTVI